MHPANPNILLAGPGGAALPTQSGIYLSTDGGEHWQPRPQTSGQLIQVGITSVGFAASDPSIAYAAGGQMFFRSKDGGVSWQLMAGFFGGSYGPPGIKTGVPIDLLVDPRNANRVFINNYLGGNFLSEDGGATWQVASKGYTGAQTHRVAVDPGDEANLFAVGRSGPFRSVDRGGNWAGLGSGAANVSMYAVALNPARSGTVLISDEFDGDLFRSTDSGLHWQTVYKHPQDSGPNARWGFKALAFAPPNPNTVYAGMCRDTNSVNAGTAGPSFGVFKSTDGGLTWRDSNDSVSATQNINVLAVDPSNENTVYAGTVYSGVLKSRDGGATWQKLNQGLKVPDVRALAVDWSNTTVLYAGTQGGGVYKSKDGGATWQFAAAGMDPTSPVSDIVVDPTNAQIVYASVITSGVYRTNNGGGLWISVNNGLSMRTVSGMAISSDGGTLYAATEGGGVFRVDIAARNGMPLTAASAASFAADSKLAPESIASAFGAGLADSLQTAPGNDVPAIIGDTSLSVTDAEGAELVAGLYFVAGGQINFLMPRGLVDGAAVVRVFRQGKIVARGEILIEHVVPGLFTANADGKGVPAALALRVGAGGAQSPVDVYRCGLAPGSCTAVPIDLAPATDQVILELFGTGIRGRTGLTAVTAAIGGQAAEVLYAGAQGGFAGLDQVNLRLPGTLAGRGDVDVVLTVDGKAANVVRVKIQ